MMSLMSEDDEDRPSEPFLERLTAEERTGLEELAGKRTFPKDSILMFQDDEDDRLLLLLSGRVKVTRAGPGDHALLLAIRGAGELLGELAFIERLPRIATVTALETVEALVLPAGRFQSYLERNPRVALVLTESVAARLRESNAKWMQFAALDTLGRLASRIVELADRYGEPSEDGVVIPMPI